MQTTHKVILSSLVSITMFSGVILTNTATSATEDDTIIDEVNVTVPVSCSMEGSGMNSHETELFNNEYDSNVGTTNIKAYCNDVNGFAIYAIGYTDDTDGKNVLTDSNLSSTNDITTGVATTGSDSKWAMKLATVTSPEPTYPITIESDQEGPFTSFHTVPDDYTLVAKRTSATDAGSSAIGSTFTTTYQIYIGPNQSAGTYNGQVKYVLVHPNYVDQETLKNAVTVVFDGNGLTFPGGATTNTVKYANLCEPGGSGYVGANYQEVMTSNITTGGTQNGAYATNERVMQPVTIAGADKLKVEVRYGITGGAIVAIEGNWDGNSTPDNYEVIVDGEYLNGTKTALINSDTVTILMINGAAPEQGYDYGMYVKVYPVYDIEQPNTTYEVFPGNDCSLVPISGTYVETTAWNGKWVDENDNEYDNEGDIKNTLEQNYQYLKGTTMNLYAYNPPIIIYHPNGDNVVGTMADQDLTGYARPINTHLYASNFSRTGYGFAGWNDQPDYSGNFYGPNQAIALNGTLNLYAVWIPSAGSLQSDAITACNGLTQDPNNGTAGLSSVTALTDERDNNTYAIAKLADGKCWMIENLRLENTAAYNTDGTLSQGYNSSFIGLANPESANFGDYTTANSLYSTDGSTAAPAITGNYTGYRFPRYNNNNTSSRQSSSSYSESGNTYSMGNYYTWHAAIADTTYYNTNNQSIENTSLCPAGWRLPKGGQTTVNTAADFYVLGKALMDNQEPDQSTAGNGYGFYGNSLTNTVGDIATRAFRKYPNNFLYSGGFGYSSAQGRHWNSRYWTSTVYGIGDSYYMALSDLEAYPGTEFFHKTNGYSIRCVLNN